MRRSLSGEGEGWSRQRGVHESSSGGLRPLSHVVIAEEERRWEPGVCLGAKRL